MLKKVGMKTLNRPSGLLHLPGCSETTCRFEDYYVESHVGYRIFTVLEPHLKRKRPSQGPRKRKKEVQASVQITAKPHASLWIWIDLSSMWATSSLGISVPIADGDHSKDQRWNLRDAWHKW